MTYTVEIAAEEFVVTFGPAGAGPTEAAPVPITLRFALPKLAVGLSDIEMLLRATSGALTAELRMHFAEHFGAGQYGLGACGFCKLQGKVLAAQGRRPLRGDEMRAAAIAPGVTAFGLERARESREAAQERREARKPQLAAPARRSLVEVLF